MSGKSHYRANQGILGYVDLETNRVKRIKTHVSWPFEKRDWNLDRTEFEARHRSLIFEPLTVYRIEARTYDRLPYEDPAWDRFRMKGERFALIRILEHDVACPELEAIREKYLQPIVWQDEKLGEFVWDRTLEWFRGRVEWMGKTVGVTVEANEHRPKKWPELFGTLGKLVDEQQEWDVRMRRAAARSLTKTANDWLRQAVEDEEIDEADAVEITPEAFAERIAVHSVHLARGGKFEIEYEDDDMFCGHMIVATCNLKTGAAQATF